MTGQADTERVWLRQWKDDPKGLVKITVYKPTSKSWGFLHYPIEAANTGWVGLSEITSVGPDTFIVLER